MGYGNTLPKNPNRRGEKCPFNSSAESPNYINVQNRFIKKERVLFFSIPKGKSFLKEKILGYLANYLFKL